MGREIRRVPQGWKHPENARGHYQPKFDQSFDDRLAEWLNQLEAFKANANGDLDMARESFARDGISQAQFDANLTYYFGLWAGGPPDENYYRLRWTEKPTCYQIYETVTEGTPVSPVFESLQGMEDWLVSEGYSQNAAVAFCKDGWAPSMLAVFGKKGVLSDIEALAVMPAVQK